MSYVYRTLNRSHFRKWLTELLGLKTPVMDVLTQYGSGLGGSHPFDFLLCHFGEAKCPVAYQGDFVDFEEHWTIFRCQAFMVAFFSSVLFESSICV